MGACRNKQHKAVATFPSWKKAIRTLDGCGDDPLRALTLAHAELVASELFDYTQLQTALVGRLEGFRALEAGEHAAAAAAFSATLASVPTELVDVEIVSAASAAAGWKPLRLKGLPPKTQATLQAKNLELVTPGRIRWVFESMVGRSRALLAHGSELDDALSDAERATQLCPLAPSGWASLGNVAEAMGDVALAAKARDQVVRLTPEQ